MKPSLSSCTAGSSLERQVAAVLFQGQDWLYTGNTGAGAREEQVRARLARDSTSTRLGHQNMRPG